MITGIVYVVISTLGNIHGVFHDKYSAEKYKGDSLSLLIKQYEIIKYKRVGAGKGRTQ